MDFSDILKNSLRGFPKLITDREDPSKTFKKDTYEYEFKSLYNSNKFLLDEVNSAYTSSEEKEELLKVIADAIVNAVYVKYDALEKKGAREQLLLDYNLTLTVYVIPFILEYRASFSDKLADEILLAWNNRFPKANVGKANFDKINEGFRNKLCYITTAVCTTLGKGDDCYELNLLRNYRDVFLMSEPDGEEKISEYYNIAPTIVKRINKSENSAEVYQLVWEEYLNPCIHLIEENRNYDCKDLYYQMVRDLEEKYCH